MLTLVAGGGGFIGSHLVDRLIRGGHEVVVVDNFATGSRENLPRRRSRRFRVIEADVANTPRLPYERIYHLASPASPDAYGRDAIGTLTTNALGTLKLLRLARSQSARFLLASTSEVYGDPLEHPQRETYWGNVNPIGPRSQYDEGKRFAEALTVAFVREHKVNAVIVRIFNTYGPRMRVDDGRMPSNFIGAALSGQAIQVHGDGSQTRSLCYVDDTVSGLVSAMERGRSGEVYNIGRDDEMSVAVFAEAVRRETKSKSQIVYVPGRPEDIRQRRPDCSKAERELRWRPRVSFAVGLRRTIAWYREHEWHPR